MNLIDRFILWRADHQLRSRLAAGNFTALRQGELLTEQLRLAKEIADECARSDIESECTFDKIRVRTGFFTWYDTTKVTDPDPRTTALVARALRYLELRGKVVRHPVQRQLVRFPQ